MTSLYVPYRAIGHITDGVPFVINVLGDEQFLISSIGKAFQIFKLDHLNSCLVSQQLPDPITGIQAYHHETFVSSGTNIYVFYRTNIVKEYAIHDHEILGMTMIGHILLSYDTANIIKIIDTKAKRVVDTLQLLQESQITFITHPATYVNKFVIGFENGQLELWNIRTKTLVYTFHSHITYFTKNKSGAKTPAVTFIEQSPACDVCAIGFSSGDIILMNLKTDIVLFTFKQGHTNSLNKEITSAGNEVTSISFRTDASAEKFPYMTTGSGDGRVYIWHLGCPGQAEEPRRLMLTLDEAHAARIGKIQFLHGEPVMVTSAEDNSIKMWIFDSADGNPRLLRSREGHRGTSNRIRFYGAVTTAPMRDNADGMSCEILSAGADNTFRLFNFALESQNREITQKPMLKKLGIQRRNERLPPIIGFDFCETRQYEWSDVATIHQNHSNTYLWRFRNRTISELVLKQPSWKLNNMLNVNVQTEIEKSRNSTSVCLSSCGNYCVVGSNGGTVYLYNAQSGLPRGSFPQLDIDPETSSLEYQKLKIPGNILHDQKKILGLDGTQDSYRANSLSTNGTPSSNSSPEVGPSQLGHTGAVTGVFLNLVNTVLVTCGLDGLVIFWNFYTHKIECSIQLSSPQCKMEPFREGDLVCVVGQDRMIRLYDLSSKKLCRRFDGKSGHSRAISDICFTPDGRRLLSASYDATVRVWDLPTSRCLSWMKFSAPITSMCMSLSGEYLCLTLADTEGIQMYLDRSLYETVHFWKEPTEPVLVENCRVKSEETMIEGVINEDQDDEEPVIISAVQAQVNNSEAPEMQKMRKEDMKQRGTGTITMAALPKAYWLTLFNLESIKERNKPIAPPTAPPQAPFFLPTIVKEGEGGIAPAFPTPAEYAKLQTPQAPELVEDEPAKELTSSWKDDDDEGNDSDWGDGNWNSTTFPDENGDSVAVSDQNTKKKRKNDSPHQSRIIRRNVELPRSHLVSRIDKQFPSGPSSMIDEEISPIKEYLMSLAPPAVDTQMRSLHNGQDDDRRGMELIHCFILWFANEFKSGLDYEILQAYLSRFLVIYSELLVTESSKNLPLKQSLQQLNAIHAEYCQKFRHLIQSNLCVLKMMAQITSI